MGVPLLRKPFYAVLLAAMSCIVPAASHADTVASLLGNFTINQYCGVKLANDAVDVHFVVVFGQLPALRELHMADANGDGVTSQAERDAYVGKLAPGFADHLILAIDGIAVPLRAAHWTSTLPTEQGGFSLRVDVDFLAPLHIVDDTKHHLQFSNQNYAGRMGWHEIVVQTTPALPVFATNAFDTSLTGGLTEALRSLPAGGPLDERAVQLSFERGGVPPDAVPLARRPGTAAPALQSAANASSAPVAGAIGGGAIGGGWIVRETRRLVDSISGRHVAPRIAILTLLGALLLGAVHALSPGHGKTIVGAYLIGSRGTPRHAVFLGLTVTITHTAGVFVLGFATLYASRFIVPERLFPILSLISALLVLGMGLILLVQRAAGARQALSSSATPPATLFYPVNTAAGDFNANRALVFAPPSRYSLAHGDIGMHSHSGGSMHSHGDGTMHSHGGGPMHSHLPPGAGGEKITWRSLLALGISGGLVPCPSAMVLLLAAVALNKTAYGMLLVVAFSVGLAITLTAVGMAFLYARNRFRKPAFGARWAQLLPVLSAATITVLGIGLCVGALTSFRS